PVPWHVVRVSPQRQNGRLSVLVYIDSDLQESFQVEPVRFYVGRTGVAAETLQWQEQAVFHGKLRSLPEAREHYSALFARTRSSSGRRLLWYFQPDIRSHYPRQAVGWDHHRNPLHR